MTSHSSPRYSAAPPLIATLIALGLLAIYPSGKTTGAAQRPGEHWKAPARAAKKKNPIPADAASRATGKKLYAQHCLSCHGAKGRGDGPAANNLETSPGNLADPKLWNHTDGELFWKITAGKKPMPTFEKLLSDEERWHVLNYMRALATKTTSAQ